MRTVLAVALLLSGVAACSTPPKQEVKPPDSSGPSSAGDLPSSPEDTTRLSASLLRRLGEAADGFRDGADRYVVAAREFPHKVLGAFLTPAEAGSIAAKSSDSLHFEVFGPYRTPPDSLATGEEDVDSVRVYMKNKKWKTYGADTVDALFWSLPAFDKFIAPNLTAVAGPLYAAEQRELYRRGRSPLAHSTAIPHYRGSL